MTFENIRKDNINIENDFDNYNRPSPLQQIVYGKSPYISPYENTTYRTWSDTPNEKELEYLIKYGYDIRR